METNKQNWKLNIVDNIEHKPDTSGIFVLINWDVKTEAVRLDIMSDDTYEPIISFRGKSDNVRKASMAYLETIATDDGLKFVSLEHAAYIGNELTKADFMRIDYIQDAEVYPSDNKELTDKQLIDKTTSDNKTAAKITEEKYS